MNSEERFSRQRDIVPADRLATCHVTIVGVGAIGRQLALQLAAMGVSHLQLVDFDVVEVGNLAAQGYWEKDIGRLKVEATAEACRQINSAIEITAVPERFRRSMDIGNVLFSAVDKIEIRRLIWDAVKNRVSFFGDGRMTAEVIRVLTACDAAGREHYPTTLFAAEEAFTGSCTAKSTIFCANIAAGMMIVQFSRYLRHMPADKDLTINLLASELSAA